MEASLTWPLRRQCSSFHAKIGLCSGSLGWGCVQALKGYIVLLTLGTKFALLLTAVSLLTMFYEDELQKMRYSTSLAEISHMQILLSSIQMPWFFPLSLVESVQQSQLCHLKSKCSRKDKYLRSLHSIEQVHLLLATWELNLHSRDILSVE